MPEDEACEGGFGHRRPHRQDAANNAQGNDVMKVLSIVLFNCPLNSPVISPFKNPFNNPFNCFFFNSAGGSRS